MLWVNLLLLRLLKNLMTALLIIFLEILKTSLLFPCHEKISIEIASGTAGLFCGTICPLM